MITKEQINAAAQATLSSSDIKEGFRMGANWAIQKMEAEMKEFEKWLRQFPEHYGDRMYYINGRLYTRDELLKKWREGK